MGPREVAVAFATKVIDEELPGCIDLVALSVRGNGIAQGHLDAKLWDGDEDDAVTVARERALLKVQELVRWPVDRDAWVHGYMMGFMAAVKTDD